MRKIHASGYNIGRNFAEVEIIMDKLILLLTAITSTIMLFYAVSSVFSREEDPLITSSDPRIQVIGRYEVNTQGSIMFDWPGVSIRFSIQGKDCSIKLFDTGNVYNVFVDGTFYKKLYPVPGQLIYKIFTNLNDGVHTVLITKRTEASYGFARFDGVIPGKNAALVSPPPRSNRRIEVIGASYSCGYGNEGDGVDCGSLKETENNYLAFGPVLARFFDAECSTVAISGKGLVRNYGAPDKKSSDPMPFYYDRKMQSMTDRWDNTQYIPQLIIINLGINDFSTRPHPDKEDWINAYTAFIEHVRSNNPAASIICMDMDASPQSEYIQAAVETLVRNGHTNIVSQSIPPLRPFEMGCDYHPNIYAHKRIADQLRPLVQDLMSWN